MSYPHSTLRLAGLVVLVLTASSLAGTPDCVTGTPVWQNLPIGTHGGYLVVQWDWTPNDAAVDGLVAVALAPPEPSVFDDYAAIVKLNPAGFFEVRDGGAYAFDQLLTYTVDATYAVRAEINIPANTYSVWVTPPAAAEVLIATDYDFRTAQQGIAELDTYGVWGDTGTHDACDFRVAASCSAPVGPAPSGTIFVDGSNPSCPGTGTAGDPLCSIQDAICFAVDGDEIVIAPGTYNEAIDLLGRAITVRSSGGAEVTTLDGAGLTTSIITCVSGEGPATLIEGLTVTGGTAGTSFFGDNVTAGGGAFFGDASPTVRDCVFIQNTVGVGGGLFADGSSLIESCRFESNGATQWLTAGTGSGGGLYLLGANATVRACTFVDNTAFGSGPGGGAWSESLSNVFEDCTFERNTAGSGGGLGGGGTVRGSTFDTNVALRVGGGGGGIIIGDGVGTGQSLMTVDGCLFVGNQSAGFGGGLYQDFVFEAPGSVVVTRSRFIRNTAQGGGGLNVFRGSPLISECEFVGNLGTSRGGAIELFQASATVTNCTIVGNTLGTGGSFGFQGGSAMYIEINSFGAAFHNCIIWDNGADPITDETTDFGIQPTDYASSIIQFYTGDEPTIITDQAPRLVDPLGSDGVIGTVDDDVRIFGTSPAVDAGDNSLVAPDVLDADGDGNTTEPVPFDLALNPRFQDDPAVPDTGIGSPPIVDIGAYEWVPVMGTPDGPRWWTEPAGGAWSVAGNWLGGAPGPNDDAVFDLPDAYPVTAGGVIETYRLRVNDGDVTLDLAGGSYELFAQSGFAAVIAPTNELQVPGLTVGDGTLTAASLLVGDRSARVEIGADVLLQVATIETRGDGELAGAGAIVGNVTNLGRIDPSGAPVGSLLIAGDFTDVGQLPDGTSATGIAGITVDGKDRDELVIAGTATLGGTLSIDLFDPPIETAIPVLSAGDIVGAFQGRIVGTSLGGRTLEVRYVNDSVEIVVREINLAATWGNGGDYSVGSDVVPSDAVLADFNNDMLPDIALSLPGDLDQVYVFFNNGEGANPDEIFNDTPGQFCIVSVGNDPIALDAADLNDDGWLDLAVANAAGNSLQILINDQTECFAPPGPVETTFVDRPTDVVALTANADALPDLAVSSLGPLQPPREAVVIYTNGGNGLSYSSQEVLTPGTPVALAAGEFAAPPGGVDNLAVVLNGTNEVQVLSNDGTGSLNTSGRIAVGTEPCYIEPEDIDTDGVLDLVVVNFGSGTLSVLKGTEDIFDPTLSFAVGPNPTSVTFADDGDQLALITSDTNGDRVVDVYRNESVPGQIVLELDEKRFVGEGPVIIRASDVDGDGADDLIAITDPSQSAPAAGGGGDPPPIAGFAAELQDPPCRADFDGNGSVGFGDLTALLARWGTTDIVYDLDGNGTVGFGDLTILLSEWGPCDGGLDLVVVNSGSSTLSVL